MTGRGPRGPWRRSRSRSIRRAPSGETRPVRRGSWRAQRCGRASWQTPLADLAPPARAGTTRRCSPRYGAAARAVVAAPWRRISSHEIARIDPELPHLEVEGLEVGLQHASRVALVAPGPAQQKV